MMSKSQAIEAFLRLIKRYGLQWTADVPASAYAEMAEIRKVLSADEMRAALRGHSHGHA